MFKQNFSLISCEGNIVPNHNLALVLEMIATLEQSLEDEDSKMAKIKESKDVLLAHKLGMVRRYPLQCPSCSEVHELNSWTFVQGTMLVPSPMYLGVGDQCAIETEQCGIICPSCKDKAPLRIVDYPDKGILTLFDTLWGFQPREVFSNFQTRKWVYEDYKLPTFEKFPEKGKGE
ncbi:MAG: hypothetical protein ACYCZ7_00090 [Minisyncoccota bacterium]